MAKKLVKKNDELSKKFLTNLDNAKEFLKLHLDPKVMAKCEIKTLTIDSGSYIDADLRKRFSDIVYKVDLKDKSSCVYIYLLIEHQSSAEKLMPLRILRYQLEIIQTHIDKYKVEYNLPLVVPLVFYNGTDSPYPYATNIRDLFADKELIDYIQPGSFKLVDLTVTPESEILKHKQLALLEMCLKHIQTRDFQKVVESIVNSLIVAHKNNLSKELFDSTLSYLMKAKDRVDLLPLFDKIIENISEYEEDIMTYAEELRQEGIKLGKQEGVQLGKEEERIAVAKKLKQLGVSEKMIAEATHLTIKQIKTLH